MSAEIAVSGVLPPEFGLSRAALRRSASLFAALSEKRARMGAWREVAVHLVRDRESARLNDEIMGHCGPTDVITQRYDPIPGGPPGLSGELFVNTDCAMREGKRRAHWTPARELLLYVAHGIDHLSGADDATDAQYRAMRRRELGWLAKTGIAAPCRDRRRSALRAVGIPPG